MEATPEHCGVVAAIWALDEAGYEVMDMVLRDPGHPDEDVAAALEVYAPGTGITADDVKAHRARQCACYGASL